MEKSLEKELYVPIKEDLESAFNAKFGHCYLEITAEGVFSERLKSFVREDIIFSFLGKKAAPDLTGFVLRKELGWKVASSSDVEDFITVEVKREKVTPQDVYQAKMYGDLFGAKYTLLISPRSVPEEIKRLHQKLFILNRFMSGWYVYIGQLDESTGRIDSYGWFPQSPFGWPFLEAITHTK